ncbi:MAG: Hsp20/alpha crystallin family protein [Treponema sp.]|nr:Hsp20/alpha crystallin family protein [Treponema sp.]
MKTITLYRPFQNLFDNVLENLDTMLPALGNAERMFNHMPLTDVRETDAAYILEMELPGYDEKNIEINVDGSNITIASKQETAEETFTYLIKERRCVSFSRSFKLPANANPEAVSASFKNGVLSLTIEKRTEAQKRIIQINAA